jgi:hypothetical protein
MKRLLLALSVLLYSCLALAAGPNDVRKQAQASLLVTGSIEVTPTGRVKSYDLDQQDKLPLPVVSLLKNNVPAWEFQPVLVDGKPVAARAKMSVRIVAVRLDDQHDAIHIEGAHFGDSGQIPGETIVRKTSVQPSYPESEIRSKVTGTVYVLLRVGRTGQVEDAVAEQVNLGVYASDRDMKQFRHDLGNAAVKALRHWTFDLPTVGAHVADPYWVARVPVNFNLSVSGMPPSRDTYGQWESYIPGPREIVPWLDKGRLVSGSPDAAPAGSVDSLDQGLQLTTPLAGA